MGTWQRVSPLGDGKSSPLGDGKREWRVASGFCVYITNWLHEMYFELPGLSN